MEIPRQPAKPPTEFERRVHEAVCKIPPGFAATYSAVAKACGCGSARAVGQALRKNPYAPAVPCHRVVRSDGSIGGFFGETSGDAIARKRQLLAEEGVEFDADGRVRDRQLRRTL